jgi:rubrerythrin
MRIRHALTNPPVAVVVVLLALGSGAAGASFGSGAAGVALSSSRTGSVASQLLVSAAKTESAAYQQYYAYAQAAVANRQPPLAGVWHAVAQVEHQDHWTHEQTLGNFYSGSNNLANLQTAITQAAQTASQDTSWAAQAPSGSAAANQLEATAARERADAGLLTQALASLRGKGTMPAPPQLTTVQIQASPKPHYSGAFYNDLTGAANSALEAAAWNWAEYQWDAKTAVDTGQANLAQLFSALEAQEQYENYSTVSNVAGYVSGSAANLETSIASEQGAINMYTQYAAKAQKAGDPSLARVFLSIRGDEMGHHQTFTAELHELTTRTR